MTTTQKLIAAYQSYINLTRKWIILPDKEAAEQFAAILETIDALKKEIIEQE